MKIVFVSPGISIKGGGVPQAVLLTNALFRDRPDVETEILAVDDHPEQPDTAGAAISLFRCYGTRRYGFAPGLFWRLLRTRADIIHVHGLWTFHAAAAHIVSLLTRRPCVVTPHGMLDPWILARSPGLKRIVSSLYQDALLRRAHCVHALTPQEGDDVRALVPAARVEVIPNYVPPASGEKGRPSWWRPDFDERQVFVFLGRIHGKKGCMELLDAWETACGRDPGFARGAALVFCGWVDELPPFEPRLDAIASRFGNVVFAGPQFGADKERSLANATYFILPSRSEGLPMAVLEAWASGTPVLITEDCHLPIGFERGAALRIHTGADKLAGELLAAFSLPEAGRREMAANAADLAGEMFSASAVADRLEAMYRSGTRK